jgi:cell division protein FtsA
MTADGCLVVVHVGTERTTCTIAWAREDGSEQIVAHKSVDCRWYTLGEEAQAGALADVIAQAAQTAGIDVYSCYVCVSDTSLRANQATGYADLGQLVSIGRDDMQSALLRAAQQPVGTNRLVLHALLLYWRIRGLDGDADVDDPFGQTASRLTCEVLLVTADAERRHQMEDYLGRIGVHLEGMIAPPVALYRSLVNDLPRRGSTVIMDFGAGQTSMLVHRKGRLVHLETHRFGGDDLTDAIARQLELSREQAVQLKHSLDILSTGDPNRTAAAGQMYLWRDVQEQHRHLGPAALVCSGILRQFLKDRYTILRDMDLLSQHGRVHLVGRAAHLGGLPTLVREIFGMEVVLGTRSAHRDPGSELTDLITVGLVRTAAEERRRNVAERSASSIRQVAGAATGLWAWLMAELAD